MAEELSVNRVKAMIRKLFISAAVLAALIYGKEAGAAGPGGFARDLASTAVNQAEVAELTPAPLELKKFTTEQRSEVIQISAAVDEAISEVDAYLDMFADGEVKAAAPQGCFDCADIKREQLIGLGWSAEAMRIAYTVSAEGRIERVLVVETALGDLVVGDGRPSFVMEDTMPNNTQRAETRLYYDI